MLSVTVVQSVQLSSYCDWQGLSMTGDNHFGQSKILKATQAERSELANYYLAHSARADMYRRLGRTAEARASYEKALALTQQEPERQFLQERIRQLK
jgi:predicted RNA polymerase sigma factor